MVVFGSVASNEDLSLQVSELAWVSGLVVRG